MKPTRKRVAAAEAEIAAEDARRFAMSRLDTAVTLDNRRRSNLPSEDLEHICGLKCDGQDGQTSHCYRLRAKLGLL